MTLLGFMQNWWKGAGTIIQKIDQQLRKFKEILLFFQHIQKKREIIVSAEAERQKIIKSDKFLSDTRNYKHHPKSFYTSRLLNESIQQAESLLNLSSTEIQFNNRDNDNGKNGLSDKKNHKDYSEQFHTSCLSSGLTQQVELSNLSSIRIASKTHHIEDDGDNNGPIRKKSKTFHKWFYADTFNNIYSDKRIIYCLLFWIL